MYARSASKEESIGSIRYAAVYGSPSMTFKQQAAIPSTIVILIVITSNTALLLNFLFGIIWFLCL